MSKILSASLRHKVILEKRAQSADGAGGFTAAWEELATLWASIERVRGGERFTGGQLAAHATHIFRIRYTHAITTDMRFSFAGRIFNIRSVHNVAERNNILDVFAEEGVAS